MRILLTQLRRIGDVVTATPAVRAVRRAYPNAVIDFLTEPPADEIFRSNPHINNIITIQRRPTFKQYFNLIKTLRSNKYDVLIDFFANPTSAYISFLSGAKYRYGFETRWRKYFYTNTLSTKFRPVLYSGAHKVILTAGIGAFPYPCGTAGYEPEFFINEKSQKQADDLLESLGVSADDKLVTMGVSVRHAFRAWPAERFAAVADALIERHNVKILFIYGPGEEEFPRKVQSFMKHQALPLYPQLKENGISRMRGIFERAALHIGCDNGPANIAKASPVPNIVIFSTAHAATWTPPDNPRYVVMENNVPCKSKCLKEVCPDPICLKNTTVEMVLACASARLG